MKHIILAVDDSKAMRYLLQTVLGKKYQVVTASDAASAMYWLSQKNFPNVILANAQLRDTADWEFVDYLKSSFLYNDIPTIILTSLEKEEVEQKCAQYNVEQFFLKPFNPVSLAEKVDELIRLRVSRDLES
jgi:CheY-like chemotaxis protein